MTSEPASSFLLTALLSVCIQVPEFSFRPTPASLKLFSSIYTYNDLTHSFIYKKVANKTKPIDGITPEEYRIVHCVHPDPLKTLPILPIHPPNFTPSKHYTDERVQAMNKLHEDFLWPEELKLLHWFIKVHKTVFAWTELEKGRFLPKYFDPVHIPTVPHASWALKNILILPGIYQKVVDIICDKIDSGVYEPSNSLYCSRWFCVLKKDGKSLRLVHDLQPLNHITICDAALLPLVDQLSESFAGRACYSLFNLFVSFDQRPLNPCNHDLTAFQTPLGPQCLTSIPMEYTNSVQIMQGDLTFILEPEIPEHTQPFIDDCPFKGPMSCHEMSIGEFKTIIGNPGIHRFVWEHFQNINRIVQQVCIIGRTFNGKVSFLCVPSVLIVGYSCTREGQIADPERIVLWDYL